MSADANIARALKLHPGFVPALRARLMRCVEENDQACACALSSEVLEPGAK